MEQKQDKKLSGAELVNPYSDRSPKGTQVEKMFDSIAPAYDFMNNAMTFGLHRWWRKRALDAAARACGDPRTVLDIATGTGDVAFDLHRRFPQARITGVDLSEGMLDVARKKLAAMDSDARAALSFRQGDSLDLGFADDTFDMVTVAYGVRNFEHLHKGYSEMFRVLRPGGTLCVIELSCPVSPVPLALYKIYSRHLIPVVGKIVSGDSRAYSYLPESIAAAPQRDDMTRIMESCGFSRAAWKSLTFGAVTYYLATK